MSNSSLSTLQRSLVALTALHLQLGPLAQVLHLYCVTEADLLQAHSEWERLQAERATQTQVLAAGRL